MEELEGPDQRWIFPLLPEGAFLQTVFAQFSSQRHIPDSLAVQRINKDYYFLWPHIIESDLGVLHLTALHLLLLDIRNLSFDPLPDLTVGTPLFWMVLLQVSSHTSSSWGEEEYWDANMLEDLLILFFTPFLGAEPRDTEGFGQPSIWQRARRPWIVKFFQ